MIRIDEKISKVFSLGIRNIVSIPNEWYIKEQDLLLLTNDGVIDAEILIEFYRQHVEHGDSFIVRGVNYCVSDCRESKLSNKTLKIEFSRIMEN